MGHMTINVVVFGIIPDAILVTYLGLILVGYRPPVKQVVLAGILQGIAFYLIKEYIIFGSYILLQYVIMIFITWIIVKVPMVISCIGLLIGLIINGLIQGPMTLFISRMMNMSMGEIMSRSWIYVGCYIPELIVQGFLVHLALKYNFNLEPEMGFLKLFNKR